MLYEFTFQTNADNTGTWSISDLTEDTRPTSSRFASQPTTIRNALVREDSKLHLETIVIDTKQPDIVERANSTLKTEAAAAADAQLDLEIQRLKEQIEQEKLKVERQQQSREKLSKEKESELKRAAQSIEELKIQLANKESHEEQFKKLTKQITAIDYDNIESIIANTFLIGKVKSIIDHLKTKHSIDTQFLGIPNLTIVENNSLYCISLTGLQEHHNEFRIVLRRIQTLSKTIKSAKTQYQRQLTSKLQSIETIMIQQVRGSQSWKHYTKCFLDLVHAKIEEFVKLYDDYILQKGKLMVEECISDANFQVETQIKKTTDLYMKKKQFLPELDMLKIDALNEYIKQHVLSERVKFEKKPSKESLATMHEFIDKVRREFKTNPIYNGCNFEQLKLIPKLLKRITLYYRCFLLQLPLYESSKSLLEKIENSTVITIATSTGSGKT